MLLLSIYSAYFLMCAVRVLVLHYVIFCDSFVTCYRIYGHFRSFDGPLLFHGLQSQYVAQSEPKFTLPKSHLISCCRPSLFCLFGDQLRQIDETFMSYVLYLLCCTACCTS